jgi:hypothetical protein
MIHPSRATNIWPCKTSSGDTTSIRRSVSRRSCGPSSRTSAIWKMCWPTRSSLRPRSALIHGGGPWYEIAIYLALKPNVWVDISAIGFLYPVPDFASVRRRYLVFAPEKVLYGTDAASYPSMPGGADVHHVMVSRATRDELYLALAGLVRDGVMSQERAIEMGRGFCAKTRSDCMDGNRVPECVSLLWHGKACEGVLKGQTPRARVTT